MGQASSFDGVGILPFSEQDRLEMDNSDARTHRGGKLYKDRQAAKGKAKGWLIFLLLTFILFVSLSSSSRDNCQAFEYEAQNNDLS